MPSYHTDHVSYSSHPLPPPTHLIVGSYCKNSVCEIEHRGGGRGRGRSRIIGIAWISIKELFFKWIFTNFSKKPVISHPGASLSYFVLAECVVQNIPF
jgi:hypothetical protein